MAEPLTYDVLLVGFRNDLARARTLHFLDGGDTRGRTETLPRLLYAGLERPEAERIRSELERLGAQVAVAIAGRPVGDPQGGGGGGDVSRNPHLARALSLSAVTLVGIGVLVFVSSNVRLQHRPKPVAAASASRPAATQAPQAALADPRPDAVSAAAADLDPRAARLNAEAIEAAKRGDFATAVGSMRRARTLAPGDATLTKNLQAMLLSWAVQAIHSTDFDAAIDRLDEASQLGDNLEVLYAVGATQLQLNNSVAAATALGRALELAPDDARILLALAEVNLKLDKRPEALDFLQRAKAAGASGLDLDRRIAQLGREVDTEWGFVERQSAHFRVSFADSEDDGVVRTVLNAFEDAYYAVGSKLGHYPPDNTAVVLYTQQDFHSITQTPDWAGGAFDGRIKLPVRGLEAEDNSIFRVARHEYTHAIVAQLSDGHCPVWLNEGLAVWAEEEQEGERLAWAEEKLSEVSLIPLHRLDQSFSRLGADAAEVAYAQSYLAVRLIVERHGVGKLTDFLRTAAHRPLQQAFPEAFDEDLASFEDRLQHAIGAS